MTPKVEKEVVSGEADVLQVLQLDHGLAAAVEQGSSCTCIRYASGFHPRGNCDVQQHRA